MLPVLLAAAISLHSTSIANVLPLSPGSSTLMPIHTAFMNATSNVTDPSIIPESPNMATKIRCDGKKFGKGLQYLSCLDALTRIPMDDIVKTAGSRGLRVFDIPLPLRFISGKFHPFTTWLTVTILLTMLRRRWALCLRCRYNNPIIV